MTLLIGGLGPTELIIILLIVLVVFGAGKLPQIGDALGKSIRNFKKSSSGQEDIDVTPPAPTSAPTALPPGQPASRPGVVDAEEVSRKA